MSKPRERRLIATADEVRAFLAGKTQHRVPITRLTKPGSVTKFQASDTPGYDFTFRDREKRWHDLRTHELLERSPVGVGDLLWIAEALRADPYGGIEYVADGSIHRDANWVWPRSELRAPFMPRGLCRLVYRVIDLRAERVQSITEDDAKAEGVRSDCGHHGCAEGSHGYWGAFGGAWMRHHGLDSWCSNGWVWVRTLERAEGSV